MSESRSGGWKGLQPPWVTRWSEEDQGEIRRCRFANNRLAVWYPQRPGQGQPLWKEKHPVRQRRAAYLHLCEICGNHMPPGDQWIVSPEKAHYPVTTHDGPGIAVVEVPVHRRCAERASILCPHIRRHSIGFARLPDDWREHATAYGFETENWAPPGLADPGFQLVIFTAFFIPEWLASQLRRDAKQWPS
jgi:hypothetical protein